MSDTKEQKIDIYEPDLIKKDIDFVDQPGYIDIPNNTNIQNRNGPRVYTRAIAPTVAPAVTPPYIGDIYIDTVALKVYIATGALAPADRQILN